MNPSARTADLVSEGTEDVAADEADTCAGGRGLAGRALAIRSAGVYGSTGSHEQ
jgi:hypothetical protein